MGHGDFLLLRGSGGPGRTEEDPLLFSLGLYQQQKGEVLTGTKGFCIRLPKA